MNKLVARLQKSSAPWGLIGLGALLIVSIFIPVLLVDRSPSQPRESGFLGQPFVQGNGAQGEMAKPVTIPVYRTTSHRIDQVPLEVYVRNVLAAEMPAEFELEALKAQAMAARTYIVKRLVEQDVSNVPVSGALVTDTVEHQAYLSEEEMKTAWGAEVFAARIEKLNRAVGETRDQIITYKGQPILAAFFSTSNGYTENSEDYWSTYIPYLRSVPSPWDKQLSPKYEQKVVLPTKQVFQMLGIPSALPVTTGTSAMRIMESTEGHRLKRVQIAGKQFSGRDVREKLGLASSQFTWKVKGAEIEITTYGYGHGVGMSQWGANGMAQQGYDAQAIVQYYYQGVGLQAASSLLNG
ncbi:stage II sporulation protein D [Paenibacillus koleovorans]|uniref:stage II sporulation protein D n=1 Tax=Paenibacillus koleovorans TaxID=121608 RepID=UPI001FEA9F09|nr:stage II sporulation protein D [Paenibacillus koleovorans]